MMTKSGINALKGIWEIWDLEESIDYFELCIITMGFIFLLMFSLFLDILALPIEIIALIIYMIKNRRHK